MRPWDIFDKFSERLEYLSSSKQLGDSSTSFIYLLLTKRPISAISVSVVKIHATTTTTRNFIFPSCFLIRNYQSHLLYATHADNVIPILENIFPIPKMLFFVYIVLIQKINICLTSKISHYIRFLGISYMLRNLLMCTNQGEQHTKNRATVHSWPEITGIVWRFEIIIS